MLATHYPLLPSIHFRIARAAGFETFVDPEILFGGEAYICFDELVDADGIGDRIGGREIFQRGMNRERIRMVGLTLGEKRDNGGAGHLGDLACGGVGDRGHAEEGKDFRGFTAFALIGRVPDRGICAEGADEPAEVIEVNRGGHVMRALSSHEMSEHRMVWVAVKSAHRMSIG